jgi:hypothetical protein
MKVNKQKNIEVVEKERDMLRITLNYYVEENYKLKEINEDLKMTVKHNKEMLKEYLDNITNKDKTVQKMNSLIDQLTERLQAANKYIKGKKEMEAALKLSSEKKESFIEGYSDIKKEKILKSPLTPLRKPEKTSLTTNTRSHTCNRSENNNLENYNIREPYINTDFLYSNFKIQNLKPISPSKSIGVTRHSFFKENISTGNNETLNKNIAQHHICTECQTNFNNMQDKLTKEIESLREELEEILSLKPIKNNEKLDLSFNGREKSMLNGTQLFNLNHSIHSCNSKNISFLNNAGNEIPNKTNKFKILNLKRNFLFDTKKLERLFENYENKNCILILQDNNKKYWELIRRNDIKEISSQNMFNIKSIAEEHQFKNQINCGKNKSQILSYKQNIDLNLSSKLRRLSKIKKEDNSVSSSKSSPDVSYMQDNNENSKINFFDNISFLINNDCNDLDEFN